MSEIDFEALAQELQSDIRRLLSRWLPGGKIVGTEYCCANLRGGAGKSLKVSLIGKGWKDFATGDVGGDLISLYAKIEGIKNGPAARILLEELGRTPIAHSSLPQNFKKAPEELMAPPPKGTPAPSMDHYLHGSPSVFWTYRDSQGNPLFYVARYESDGKKEIIPYSWNPTKKQFVQKSYARDKRPIYGLEQLTKFPTAQVLIVEGEKSADAARVMFGPLKVSVISWPNGSESWQKVDWSPLVGRKVILWPDADRKQVKDGDKKWIEAGLNIGDIIPGESQPGLKAMLGIAESIKSMVQEIRLWRVTTNTDPKKGPTNNKLKDGWDAADALAEQMTWEQVIEWARPFSEVYHQSKPNQEIIAAEEESEEPPEPEDLAEMQDDFSSPGHLHTIWESMGVGLTKAGSPVCNVDNALRVLERWQDLKDIAWFDEFHQKFYTEWGAREPREWSDLDDLRLLGFFQRELGFARMSDDIIRKAVMIYGSARVRNEPRDWMNKLKWDGVPRVRSFFVDCFGTENTPYNNVVSKNWWVSMVARIMKPGCKVDNMVVLEGEQGKFKSTALDVIGGKWYTETHELPTDNDFYMVLQGKLIIEISEFHSFLRADPAAVKACVTRRTDRYRAPYARRPADYPRQCIFCGSINEDSYLNDPTGARRFWPVKIGNIDLGRIRENRDQLFAEAVKMYKSGEVWYEVAPGSEQQQENRRQVDSWENMIEEFVTARLDEEQSILDIGVGCLGYSPKDLQIQHQRRIGKIMRQLGYKTRNTQRNGASVRIFYKDKIDLPGVE